MFSSWDTRRVTTLGTIVFGDVSRKYFYGIMLELMIRNGFW
jgi:hypothetical protein